MLGVTLVSNARGDSCDMPLTALSVAIFVAISVAMIWVGSRGQRGARRVIGKHLSLHHTSALMYG
jgi:hypothetical protein